MDLSGFVPRPDRPNSLFFEELVNLQKNDYSREDLINELSKNKTAIGKFKLEYPLYESSYMALPIEFISIREKSYYCNILFKKNLGDEGPSFTGKIVARGAVPKKRSQKFSLEDFKRMGEGNIIESQGRLFSLRSKNFSTYEIMSERRETAPFSRKRYILSSGKSAPYFYHRNEENDRDDCKKLNLNLNTPN